jgi:signal transduction histidine kinase
VDASDALKVADSIVGAMSLPAQIRGQPLNLKASIGISVFPDDGDDGDGLIDRREANEQLLLAALRTQELLDAAELAYRGQAELMGVLAHELRGPLGPITVAAALMGRAGASRRTNHQESCEAASLVDFECEDEAHHDGDEASDARRSRPLAARSQASGQSSW